MSQGSGPNACIEEMHRPLPAPFLTKTYQLVDDSSTDDIISWNECGSAFVVWRPPEFARDLLPSYFKHNNFSSFVRQLNTYGFKKIVPDRWEFANDCFKKGERHLLIHIHRRRAMQLVSVSSLPSKRPASLSNSDDDQAVSSGSSPLGSPSERSAFPSPSEAERLKKENMLLAAEVSCLRKLCMDLVFYIQNHGRTSAEDLSYMTRLLSCSGSSGAAEQVFGKEIKQESDADKAHQQDNLPCQKLVMSYETCERGQREPPKLFGVPLPFRSRRLSEHQNREHGCS